MGLKEHAKHLEKGDRKEIALKLKKSPALISRVIDGSIKNQDVEHALMSKILFRQTQKAEIESMKEALSS